MKPIFQTIVVWLLTTLTAAAQDIPCNSTYTTQRGDTLSVIAERAYDRSSAYQRIFTANPGKLKSVNILPIGIGLYIPCEEVSPTSGSAGLAALRTATSDNIKILTGDNYAPYVDRDLENGGFSFELIERAMQFGVQPADYRVDVINDWESHFDPLMSGGAYDVGFPWFRPDCDKTELLGEASKWRCDNLRFSEPLHEIVVTAYAPAAAPAINSAADARGLTICRPAGYFTHDLEAMGLGGSTINRVAPDTPDACFRMLRDGEVDLVSVNADTADRIITKMGMAEAVQEVIELSTVQTLRAVGLKSNPKTRVILNRINKGLKGLHENGDFTKIAAQFL